MASSAGAMVWMKSANGAVINSGSWESETPPVAQAGAGGATLMLIVLFAGRLVCGDEVWG